jgi:prepilin-type N-terminal cleavage/methylation domain-containing protein
MLRLMKSEKGFTLIEVLISLTLLGIVAVALLGGLFTSAKALIVADKQTSAESLSGTEMEYVKKQEYSVAPWSYELPSGTSPTGEFPEWWNEGDPHTLPPGYDGYTVTVSTAPLHATDDGIQKITITVKRLEDDPQDVEIIILEGYKTS